MPKNHLPEQVLTRDLMNTVSGDRGAHAESGAWPGGPRLITIHELSRRLSIPKGTLYNWVYLRRIPFVKAGRSLRFDVCDVIRSLPHSPTMEAADPRWKGHQQHGSLP